MKVRIEVSAEDLKSLVLKHIRNLGISVSDLGSIKIETKSKQNYKAEWESADFRATYEYDGTYLERAIKMKVRIEVSAEDLKSLVLKHIRNLGISVSDLGSIKIETKSKQNYKAEWESADFCATYEYDGTEDV